MITKEIEIDGE